MKFYDISKWAFTFVQVVQEYERAVIFRLGRLLHGGSRGPGNEPSKINKCQIIYLLIYKNVNLVRDGFQGHLVLSMLWRPTLT